MRVRKAVITAAAPDQRRLPLQNLIDRDGVERSVLAILLNEVFEAQVEEVSIVVCPGGSGDYAPLLGEHASRVSFVEQQDPRGYGHAVCCSREFVGRDPFLHIVSDHLFVSSMSSGCASRLVSLAEAEGCAVSCVQATRENLLGQFGAIGGKRLSSPADTYQIDTVLEKPTPTEAEQRIIVPGLRAGHYLCFFGMHVLKAEVMDILDELLTNSESTSVTLSSALDKLASRERYLALQMPDRRYDLGSRYGVFCAQLALALSGQDRNEVLSQIVELLALRESATGESGQ